MVHSDYTPTPYSTGTSYTAGMATNSNITTTQSHPIGWFSPQSETSAYVLTSYFPMQTNPDRAYARTVKDRRAQRRDAARDRAMSRSSQGGKLLRVLSDDPADINVYGHGGERTRDLARTLKAAVPTGIFFYQRRLARTSTDDPIDLLAMVPSGIWVIDIQTCAGGPAQVKGRKHLLSSHYTHLVIRGRDRTANLDRLVSQARSVEDTLAELGRSGVPVRTAFCFYDTDTQWRGTPRVGQTLLTTPRRLTGLLQNGSHKLRDTDIVTLAQALGDRLPRQHVRD